MAITQNHETLKGEVDKSDDCGRSYLIVVIYSFLVKATLDFFIKYLGG